MKTRVISAVVGIILLIIVLNFFQTPVLNLAIMVIALIAMHEFLTATKINHNKLLSAVTYLVAAAFPFVPMQREMNLLPVFLLPYIALLFFNFASHSPGYPGGRYCAYFHDEHWNSAVSFGGNLFKG